MEFICNLCGRPNRAPSESLDREKPSCSFCGSNVRTRGLVHTLSIELFGASMPLPDFPRIKSLRAMGASDSHQYADRLAEKFDYRNTFYDRAPRFDIMNPAEEEYGKYDFLISSEVFEHVAPPAEAAFHNACRVLKPDGFLVLTAPYSIDQSTAEHFPDLYQFGMARIGDQVVLVNRTREGRLQVFENLVFHRNGPGEVLEMREFSQSCLTTMLTAAGFTDVRIYAEDHPRFGIVYAGAWSLPMVAHKRPFTLGADAAHELVEQWREMMRIRKKFWVRLGAKIGLL